VGRTPLGDGPRKTVRAFLFLASPLPCFLTTRPYT
jgi:hypothetical protein